MQPYFAGDFYGAYPGADLATDPFLALVNGSSGLAPGTSLTGLVSRTSGGLVRAAPALHVDSLFNCDRMGATCVFLRHCSAVRTQL